MSVSAFGRLSGNTSAAEATRRWRSGAAGAPGTRAPPCCPTGPSGETVAASSGQGKMPRRQPCATSRQSRIQPKPCVQPEHQLGVVAEAADRRHHQRGEDAHLDERVDPDGLEIGHGLRVWMAWSGARPMT